jgi:outer membrane immunogenic protein
MKKFIVATSVALGLMSAPAMANGFDGPRVEVTAGFDDVRNGADDTKVTYGATTGYDRQFGRVVVGVEATAANVFDRADLGVGARLGVVPSKDVLIYGRVGYANLNQRQAPTLDGVSVGGGIEANVVGPFYTKAEYRYTDFSGTNTGRHAAFVGAGIRF